MNIRPCIVIALSLNLASSLPAQDTVQVKAGWNIIGSVKGGVIPDVLTAIPDGLIISSYWAYTPGVGYSSTDTLKTGLGYWVKVKEDGLIVFNTTPAIDSCKSKAMIYQGKLYNTVKIGNQCWMAENLDVGTMVTGVTDQADNDTTEKYCYDNDPLNCALYGGLYQWDEAVQYSTTPGAQGICPAGWHIPTHLEYYVLNSTVNRALKALEALRAVGQGVGNGAGTNYSGFSGLIAGTRYSTDGSFHNLENQTFFWSSGEHSPGYVGVWGMDAAAPNFWSSVTRNGNSGYSVRCLED